MLQALEVVKDLSKTTLAARYEKVAEPDTYAVAATEAHFYTGEVEAMA